MPQPAVDRRSSLERVRFICERNARALALRPSVGQGVAVTHVRWEEGFACEVREGDWKFTVDLGEKSGGRNRGPNPGILGRAALGSCLAMGYAMWAARLDVPIAALEVEVQAAYDSRGLYGVDGVEPGYKGIRVIVTVESPAPKTDVLRVLDMADRHSDYLYVFERPQSVVREVRFRAREV